jgi:hypothetical protein
VSAHRLAEFASARSGDKADLVTLALFAPNETLYGAIAREVTAARVAAHFIDIAHGAVDRHLVPTLHAVHFVLHEALDGGAAHSLRYDQLGKSYGALLLRLAIDLTTDEEAAIPR